MAATNRLRYNGLLAGTAPPTLGADISSGGTAITFPLPLKYQGTSPVPTIADPDYLPLVINPDTAAMEIVWLTAYTAGATSGTILRAQEGTSGVAHTAGADIAHGPTVADIPAGSAQLGLFAGTWIWSAVASGYTTLDWATVDTQTTAVDRGGIVTAAAGTAPVIGGGRIVRVDMTVQISGGGGTFRFADLYDTGSSGLDISDLVTTHSASLAKGFQLVDLSVDCTLAIDVEHDAGSPPITLTVIVTEF